MDHENFCEKTVTQNDLDIFKENARLLVVGSSNSGKTKKIIDLILFYEKKFDKIYICGSSVNHELSNFKILKNKIYFFNHFPSLDEIKEISAISDHKLLVMDDVYYKAFNDINVLSYFTHGRHINTSTIIVAQNLFYTKGKYTRDISLNATHFLILRTRDLSQLKVLSRQIYGSENVNKILNVYQFLIKEYRYPHLLIDISGNGFFQKIFK